MFRAVISRIDPERAHRLGLLAVRRGGWAARALKAVRLYPRPARGFAVQAMGLDFPAPLGIAAGLDKDATAVRQLADVGFAFVEVGTVTPRPQPGNPRPRSWRHPEQRALRNRMGFNNAGADAAARNLAKLRRSRAGRAVIVGANIGKNKDTTPADAPLDYAYCARVLAPHADYLVVNVSSPNTPGLRDLQSVESLRPILEAARRAADEATDAVGRVPLLVKIAPDLADEDVDAVAALVADLRLDGVVATNTTIAHDYGEGGLSGPPLLPRSLQVVARLRAALGRGPCIIGVGGISSVTDARAMLTAGANLVQAYTAMVYQGPLWPARVNHDLSLFERRTAHL